MKLKSRVIVVGLDFSALADRAFLQAHELAAVSSTSEIHAIHVMAPAAVDPHTGQEASVPTSAARMDEGVSKLSQHVNGLLLKLGGNPRVGMRVYSHFRIDVPWVGVTRLAAEVEASLIIVGTHGRHGVARWLLGSVAEGVMRHAACPVLVIPLEAQVIEPPKLEPACSQCIQARRGSQGRELWCVEHREHQGRRHTYHPTLESLRVGSVSSIASVMPAGTRVTSETA